MSVAPSASTALIDHAGPLRVAFLTPEYRTEGIGGGLASYVRRMCDALRADGHDPEVFVLSDVPAPVVATIDGIRIQRCARSGALPKALADAVNLVARACRVLDVVRAVRGAAILAAALEARHRVAPFDIVQSSDFSATGLFVKRLPTRTHVVRSSWVQDIFTRVDGPRGPSTRMMGMLERRCLRRADAAYAPSQFVARLYRERFGISLEVLPPPARLETAPAPSIPAGVPERYLVHIGRISRRKGSEVLARALPQVWKRAPDFRMVWIGPVARRGLMEQYRRLWGDRSGQIIYLGPLPSAETYAVLQSALASVTPSLVDNLPNAVIESLLLDVPVVGTFGSSIDELVEDGVSGLLVPPGDAEALAEALVRVWQTRTPWQGRPSSATGRVAMLTPSRAVARLLAIAARPRAAGR